eukprot:COSAG06_NODE_60200_length_271_cov_1.494186_1_plen_34_part_10
MCSQLAGGRSWRAGIRFYMWVTWSDLIWLALTAT